MSEFKTIINEQPVLVSEDLQGYTLYHRQSSMVSYIGVNAANDTLFIQFLNGMCFKYEDVPVDFIKAAVDAHSIGKFFHSAIKGKYEGVAIESHCIEVDTEADDEDVLGNHFGDIGSPHFEID